MQMIANFIMKKINQEIALDSMFLRKLMSFRPYRKASFTSPKKFPARLASYSELSWKKWWTEREKHDDDKGKKTPFFSLADDSFSMSSILF